VRVVDQRVLNPDRPVDVRLAVIGADDDVIAVEERIQSTRSLDERRDRTVASRQRFRRTSRAERMGREVVVREVEEQEVETVTRDQPASYRCRVGVD
jgi:hypothetical protein